MKMLPVILLTLLCFCSCRSKVSSDIPPQQQAVEIAKRRTPEKVASSLIDWLLSADTTQREFSRKLSANILLYYDTIGSPDSARRFVSAFDSITESLPASKQARILLALNTPAKTASLLARKKSDERLINEIKTLLEGNTAHLQQFTSNLEATQKQINRLENENSEPIRSDD